MPNCTDLHPDSEITTASIKCCSLYKPGEQGYNKKRVKCAYAMNKQYILPLPPRGAGGAGGRADDLGGD